MGYKIINKNAVINQTNNNLLLRYKGTTPRNPRIKIILSQRKIINPVLQGWKGVQRKEICCQIDDLPKKLAYLFAGPNESE